MDKRYFSDKVVKWYELNRRDLPWRESRDPYKIWLSEIILQQTRVSQGMPYYLKFVEKFPDVSSLAAASEQEVLRLWQGLGYYSRARNLHKCAQQVVSDHNSIFPRNFETLKKLKGIGDYTAAAIASIAFKESVPVVDGNVFRVLSRAFGIEIPINTLKGKRTFTELAAELIKGKQPDVFNQAVMEFGALYCTPKKPDCAECILHSNCFASKSSMQCVLPVKLRSKAARARYFYYFVVRKGNSFLMRERREKDIWNGLFDFFLLEKSKPEKIEKVIRQFDLEHQLNINSENVEVTEEYKQVLSHQIIYAKFIILRGDQSIQSLREPFAFYSRKKIEDLPKPVLINRFLSDYQLL